MKQANYPNTSSVQDSFFSSPLEKELASFKKKKFSPVYVVFGEEQFLAEEFSKALIEHTVGNGGNSFNLDILQGNEVSLDKILSCTKQMPMMSLGFDEPASDRRVVIVKNFELGRKKDSEEKLFSYLKIPSSSTTLVLEMPKLDMKTELYKKLSTYAQMITCKTLEDGQVFAWLANEFGKQGKKISRDVCIHITAAVGNSLNELSHAVEKLVTFAGEREMISVEDVEEVIGISKTYNIWELQGAVGAKNLPRSMEILQRLLEMGENAVGIVAILSTYFMNQLKPKTPWNKPSGYTYNEIQHALSTLAATDGTLKSSQTDDRVVLTVLLHRIVPKR